MIMLDCALVKNDMTQAQKVMKILETERLILRTWREEDFAPFCAMNQNPKVMEYFPSVLNESESRAIVDKVEQHFQAHGYTWYSTVLKSSGAFIGMVGVT
ncbi:MAG: hypothetical protein DHS20C10_06290 [marine bacterium B5-7]|nr:MAG: hypothetical protein DHS20C10_06290 [marine bacterium B5-7]